MITTIGGKEVHVTYITADGQERESMDGYLTSIDQLPATTQRILAAIMGGCAQRQEGASYDTR